MKVTLLILVLGGAASDSCKSKVISGILKIKVDGQEQTKYVVDQWGGSKVSGDELKIPHGPRVYLGNKCTSGMKSGMFWHPDLTKYSLSFTADFSDLGCGCNGALYLVDMPGPSKTSCGDYYCDANYVCGPGCAEMDVIEANNMAAAITPHACGSDGKGQCDGAGCGIHPSSFGPGASFAIDTTKKFRVHMAVDTSFQGITTTLSQAGHADVVVRHNEATCGSGYLQGMAGSWDRMVITASNWGDAGSSMLWLDGNVCPASTSCNQGNLKLSDLRLDSLGNYTGGDGDDYEPWEWPWWQGQHAWWAWLAASLGLTAAAAALALLGCCLRRSCALAAGRDGFCDANAGPAPDPPPPPPRPARGRGRGSHGSGGAPRSQTRLQEPLLGGPRDTRRAGGRPAGSTRSPLAPRHAGAARKQEAPTAESDAVERKSRGWLPF